MKVMRAVVDRLDVSKHIANHLVGRNHSHIHRRTFGMIIMVLGVLVVKLSYVSEAMAIHIAGDVIGFGAHGIGLIPFAKGVEKGGSDD